MLRQEVGKLIGRSINSSINQTMQYSSLYKGASTQSSAIVPS